MISIAMLRGGTTNAAYYLDRAAECDPADYYTRDVQRHGRWVGPGAAAAGLTGVIDAAGGSAFAGLLDGRLPDGTVVARPVLRADPRGLVAAGPLLAALRQTAVDYDLPVPQLFADAALAATATNLLARVDKAGPRRRGPVDARVVGELAAAAGLNPYVLYPPARDGTGGFASAYAHVGAKVDMRRSGLDVTVSAPKSVSVLYALAGPSVSAAVMAAHEYAVSEALGYLDRHAAHGMRGHQGDGQRTQRVGTDGLVAAAFVHDTSRTLDPQLHTHLVIANLVHGSDGKWTAVDSRAMHRHARTAGCLYQAVLRGQLSKTLGVEWEPVRKGVAEIAGIPTSLLKMFSSRRAAIETELDRTGSSGRKAAQRAAYRTRPTKTRQPERSLRARWAAVTREHLQRDPADLVRGVLGRNRSPRLPDRAALAAELFGPHGLTRHATSFDRRDVIQALTDTLPTGADVTAEQVESLADEILTHRDVVPLLRPAAGNEQRRYTAADLLRSERIAIACATRISSVPVHGVSAAALAGESLSGEQRDLVVGLLTSPRFVDVVGGPAGSGKTTALRTAATGWQAEGIPVVGCAVAAITARRLEAATGMLSTSVAKLLTDADTYGRDSLPHGVVIVVDEASMVGTRDLTRLLRLVSDRGGKVVLVGDPHQLPEIDAGGLFGYLARTATPLKLTANQRQSHGWERDALLQLRAGDVATAVDAYVGHGRVHVHPDSEAAAQALAAHFAAERSSDGIASDDVVAIASTRQHVAVLNDTIRAQLRSAGQLGADVMHVAGPDGESRSYAIGDTVLVTANDYQLGLLNGLRGTVTAGSDGALTLSVDGASVQVGAGWVAEHLHHGYAVTAHKAQGLTCRTALVYGSAALCQQAAYVALSRGVTDNHLYTAEPLLEPQLPGVDIADDLSRFQLLDRANAIIDVLAERIARAAHHTLAAEQDPYEHDRWLRDPYARDDGRDFGMSR